MTKMTKNILMVGGVAIVGYLIYKKFGNKPTPSRGTGTSSFTADEEFFSANGTRRTRSGSMCSAGSDDPSCNLCGESCVNNRCNFATYNQNGQITGYRTISCQGTGESGGYGTTLLQGKRK
jgi:hypothetical protein